MEDKKDIGEKSEPESATAPMRKVIKAQIGYLGIPDLSPFDVIDVFDQRSGQQVGDIRRGKKLPVPPGTYNVKFGKISQVIEVEAGQEVELSK